ncbi:phospholipase D family protein [Gallaecimonas sp. GXIMD4217]|uniref:phospholipase D family protein n=1 Tax=Gallaecimonas sp. GXIMD4217 TaxID=3131927 RepID=UPI00311ABEB9
MSGLRWWLTSLSLVVAGAANRVPRFAREPMAALPPHDQRHWRRRLGEGFRLLADGKEALAVRLALIEQAQVSIDAQYYQWKTDSSGQLLLSALVDAADRGVRVRLLVDDIHTNDDPAIARINAHPNIHIRLFNPFGSRVLTPITRPLEWLWDFSRANHRMHNKALVVDGEVVIIGGRNVGDEYFGLHPRRNFLDTDVLALGDFVDEVIKAFDLFFNCEWSVPVSRLILLRPIGAEVKLAFRRLREFRDKPHCRALLARLPSSPLEGRLLPGQARVIYDKPHKVRRFRRRAGSSTALVLSRLAQQARKQLLVFSPYLVPSQDLIARLGIQTGRGVRTRFVTNSLAANDVIMAHTGYQDQRPALLSAGVELNELARDAPLPGGKTEGSHSSLHAKLLVYDRSHLYIGTFNMDPRSIFINTEMGLLIDCEPLAREVTVLARAMIRSGHCWQPRLDGHDLIWWRRFNGSLFTSAVEPQSSLWRRLLAWLLSWLPVRNQL